jgi:signal transduction histidine kinase
MEIQPGRKELSKSEISLKADKAVRHFSIGLTHLLDRRSELIGYLVLLHDTTGQKHAQEMVMEHQRVVATLNERERLARELHDSIGQVLGYISMQAQTAQKLAESGNAGKTASILNRLTEVAREAHADVRESILSLRTDLTSELNFIQALQKYLNHFQTSFGIDTELLLPDQLNEDALSPEVRIQVMRVIQEALNNASRHGGAQSVKVAIVQEDGSLNIIISDDGSGFNPAELQQETGKHFGLVFMRERMAQIGGSINIKSQPGSGTTVQLELPSGI